jgi:uncharacterized protein YciI
MPYFLCKLIPPHTAALDKSDAVRGATLAHQDYWLPYLNAGLVIVMGPVDDPGGGYSVMIAHAPSLKMLEDWQADDPAILSGLDFRFENYPMPTAHVAPTEPLAPVSSISP